MDKIPDAVIEVMRATRPLSLRLQRHDRRLAQAKLMKGGGFYEEERQGRKEVLKQGGGGNLAVLSLTPQRKTLFCAIMLRRLT